MKNWQKVVLLMEHNPKVTREMLERTLGLSRSGVAKIIRQIVKDGKIRRDGPDKGGRWAVIPSTEEPKYFFFYGHDPKKLGHDKACFSQWYIRPFTVDGHRYNCMEQYMMSEKARIFRDIEMMKTILNESDPAKVKAYGRQVKGFNPDVWHEQRSKIVFKGNYAKFSQHADLKRYLLDTGDMVLVEASPFDTIWGIGMRANKTAENHNNWRGLNLLGYALTAVKKQILVDEILADAQSKTQASDEEPNE